EPGELLHGAVDADPRPDLRLPRSLRARRHPGCAPRPGRASLVSAAPILAIDRLTRTFGALAALAGVSFQVAPRERRAIIGPNGAGKTTLFNVITGQLAPSAGRGPFAGHPGHRLPRHGPAK